ncbi:4Fe-4S ferredoxin [Virgisporangium aliadipatigenens]|uniref:4Fe-4S ferredoxin n=1 Tax=Virgisporangium aliadipatigenens TaxID=741659 RepID=A0A8J3YPK3_9ACTN|nr:4Fe-4S dicluster domain-containing protein [Virgisporangium aliadipatigenens]GIJ48142.1 4Fe-4S ferredoxin [Virgisporangium aliadipatigenens]
MFQLPDLDGLFAALHADGYRIVGPTVSAGAIVLAELDRPAHLPYGVRVETAPGHYRLRPGPARQAFTHTAGPQAWKEFLQPSPERLWRGTRDDEGFRVDAAEEPPRPTALLGVRPCDLRALGILDGVLGDGERYARRRAASLVIAVDCTEPGEACFCVSAGGGPAARSGFDIGLVERPDGGYLARAATDRGTDLLARLAAPEASDVEVTTARKAVDEAAARMGRRLPEVDLRDLLTRHRTDDTYWSAIAERCLACANCTMVCPTCFCARVTDVTDLTGEHAERWQRADSCFDPDFSYVHGGPVRSSTGARYRQWISHKFATWHDQFGGSGCVGCGRCVVWCPVGIDITAELHALAQRDRS